MNRLPSLQYALLVLYHTCRILSIKKRMAIFSVVMRLYFSYYDRSFKCRALEGGYVRATY